MSGAEVLLGPVEVVGTGLIGTSIALACRRAGIEVLLTDASDDHVRTASGLGAGRPRRADDVPQLVVVAVPPDALGAVLAATLDRVVGADEGAGTAGSAGAGAPVVTDVGSVKGAPLDAVAAHLARSRYVGSHPMAGTEHSGPLTASAVLFDGRPWAVTPGPDASPDAVRVVEALVRLCGAQPVLLSPAEHDRAVARTSHVPHLMASLVAGTLAGASAEHLALSGTGVRDVTRVAGGDPRLYSQIIGGNAGAVAALLREVRERLDLVLEAVTDGDRAGLEALLAYGRAGTHAIPGKHGGAPQPTAAVRVAVPDHPGELARLFSDAGESGVNIEDVRIDHDPGRPVGLVELDVVAVRADVLRAALESRGWTVHR